MAYDDDGFWRPRPRARVVKLERRNGVIVNPYDVYVGRECKRRGWNLERSKFANPYAVGRDGSRADVCRLYIAHLKRNPHLVRDARVELRGKVLGCWCKPQACHADTLAAIANGEDAFFD